MNCQKLYALARAFEDIGLSKDEAFERAFHQYNSILKDKKC